MSIALIRRFAVIAGLLSSAIAAYAFDGDGLLTDLHEYIDGKDARIGVAVVVDGTDTISIDGNREFPMMSVFKFPLALTVAYQVDSLGRSFDDIIQIDENDLKENTYSPMLKKYGKSLTHISLRELLEWSLKESDNNAADILLKYVGGINGVNELMPRVGISGGIEIGASEDDMHRDVALCYLNRATPLAMVSLFDSFCSEMKRGGVWYNEIAKMIETCRTGTDRLPAPFTDTGAVVGHKTGTGDVIVPGRISAINDCGYVLLPDGHRYSISVFIADSAYGMDETSAMIGRISQIVLNNISPNISNS